MELTGSLVKTGGGLESIDLTSSLVKTGGGLAWN